MPRTIAVLPAKLPLLALKLLVRAGKRNDFSRAEMKNCDMRWAEAVQKYFKKNEKNACQGAKSSLILTPKPNQTNGETNDQNCKQ
jgi:hypothetical protein